MLVDIETILGTWEELNEIVDDGDVSVQELHDLFLAASKGNDGLDQSSFEEFYRSIDDLFDDIVTARTAGAAKPARKIFDVAVEVGGASAEQTLHVGDHPEYDVDGAMTAGLHAVWVNRSGEQWPRELPKPHGIVTHVGQLPALLARARG